MTKIILLAVFFAVTVSASHSFAKLGNMVFDDKAGSREKAKVAPAVFPHGKHEDLYKCDDCHPKIFKDKRGTNDITMQKNIDGEFCGAAGCHNSPNVFPLYQCKKCHIQ